jgi:murein L,D-transpeptidase YafK
MPKSAISRSRQSDSGLFALIVLVSLMAGSLVRAQSPETNAKVDSILILKREHLLELRSGGAVVRTYHVALGRGGLAPKQQEGDARTPEGRYVIDLRNSNSSFYRALHISYPNAEDRKRANLLGVSPGGAIMIHGLPNGIGFLGSAQRLFDWTQGCVAVTDKEMDEIWGLVAVGTPVEIQP